MKILLLVFLAIEFVQCDKLDRTYLPPQSSILSGGYAEDLNIPLEYARENYPVALNPERFAYSFNTTNGIHVDESGTAVNGVKAIGSYSFTGDNGKVYTVKYTADEKGFIPQGEHLPTPPPIPRDILKSIQQAEKNRQLGIIDDGSYDDAKYGYERYQGTKGRLLYHRLTNSANNNPEKTVSPQNSKQISDVENDGKDSNLGYQEVDFIADPNSQSKTEKANININPIRKDQNFMEESRNKHSNIDAIQISPGKLNSMDKTISKERAPDADLMELIHEGYHYVPPQNRLNNNRRNGLQSQFLSTTSKPFITPKLSFPTKSQEDDPNVQILRTNFKDPFMSTNNEDTFEDLQKQFYSSSLNTDESDNTNTERNISTKKIRVLSTLKSTYDTSTSFSPYYYESRHTPIEGNAPVNTSFIGATLLANKATTILPSEILSNASSFISSLDNRQATPLGTSTLGTSFATRGPEIKQQEPGSVEMVAGQNIDFKYFAMQPNNFDPQVNGKPSYQSASENTFVLQEEMYGDQKPGIEESTDSSTDVPFLKTKIIGEDFSGPKQLQRFDPNYGYYY